ncbi:MAG: ATP-binding protein [Akkermansiaceae bacterium]|jgi:two-component system, OmpR family, heavy metal sensor histidine kinase CusS|nr:ATP-binding protein [Akkermansiaceae bacterium]
MRPLNPSIRKRLLLGTVLTVAVATLTGSVVIYFAQSAVLTRQLDDQLIASSELLTIEVELEDGKPFQEWLLHIEANELRKEKDLIQVWEISSGATFKSPALGNFNLPKISGELNQNIIQDVELPGGREGRALGVKILPSYDESTDTPHESVAGMEHIFVVALETKVLHHALTHLHQTLIWVVITTIILTAFSIAWIIRQSLVPIRELSLRIEQRKTDQLGNPIVISNDFPRELRGLVNEYNRLLERIEGVRSRERDFSTHAAHELRTPLAGIQATLEQALTGDHDSADYSQRIRKALAISREMASLVNHLMRFSRLRSGTQKVIIEEINLHELIEATILGYSEKARARGLQIDHNLSATTFLQKTDEDLVRILFSNFFDNATSYAEANSSIKVQTVDREGAFVLSISNHSAAALPANLDRLFEPFFRIDQARGGEDRHSGIGLSLCREIAHTLDVQINASISDSQEFQVEVRFEV